MTWLARLLGRFIEATMHAYRAAAQARHEREHPPVIVPRLLTPSDSPEMDLTNEFVLRDSLRKALRQHHPDEPVAQA